MHYNGFIIVLFILIGRSYGFLRSENLTVTFNEHVRLLCTFPQNFSPNNSIIQWKKLRINDDALMISINGKIPNIYEKFYRTDLTNRFSTLELFHVKRDDSTTYICQTFETQTILCQHNVVVLIKPEAPTLTIDEENIQEYQTVKLTCSSSNGNPPPQYTWYRNGTLVTSLNQQVSTTDIGSIYTFNVTRFDNQVKYECHISNPALSAPLRVEQYLHVKYRPYVEIAAKPSSFLNEKLIGIEFNEHKLTCLINANPAVSSVYWTINNTHVVSREINVYLSRLTSEQSGLYTCVVENAIGKTNQSIYLDVQYGPRVRPIESRVIVNRSNTAILRCYVDSNPLPYQIVWFKNGYEIFRQNQLSDLRIDHVERNDSGLYTCTVYNRLQNNVTRNGSASMELIVQSRPILETTHSKVAAEIGQTITLTCRVSGEPKPNIYWKRNEQIINCDDIIDERCYLRLFHVTKKDFGAYRCIAENLLGKEEWTYTIVSKGKPETPHDIRVSDVTSSSFKIQFSPSFDGGAGPPQFIIEVISHDTNTTFNSTILNQQLPFNTYEYDVKDLNESTLYIFRIKAVNKYGESPWSVETSVQTLESILTSDDLPQFNGISYNHKENFLYFDYLPGDERLVKLNNQQLCLNIRQSHDGSIYQSINDCIPINDHRVKWVIKKDFPYLKLSICSKKYRHICGPETIMKEDSLNQSSAPMIIGITVTTMFLVLIIIILTGILCFRWRKNRLSSKGNKTNKFGINGLENGVKPIISEPRLQNPYLLYSNTNSHTSPYDFTGNEYQQRKIATSFSRSCDVMDRDQPKDEISVHDACPSYGTATRAATIHASPHWLLSNGGSSSRSGSNPSSELSCLTQNTNILLNNNDINTNNHTPPPISHYGFPSTQKSHPLINGNATLRSSSFEQQQPSSGNSTPNRMKKLFYEVVV